MTGALLSFSASARRDPRARPSSSPSFEILSIRSGFGLVVLLVLVAVRPDLRQRARARAAWACICARNTIHFFGQYSWALAVTLLPFATVFALEFTMPVWVALLAVPLLGERMTKSRARQRRRSAFSACW